MRNGRQGRSENSERIGGMLFLTGIIGIIVMIIVANFFGN